MLYVLLVFGGVINAFYCYKYKSSHCRCSIEKQVAFRDDALRLAHEDLFETKSILENVILSTCNTEVYAIVDQIHRSLLYSKILAFIWI